MNLDEFKQAAVQELLLYEPIIVARQQQFFADNGHYFQGLATHSVLPSNGERRSPDLLNNKPSDQAIGWQAPDFPITMPFCLQMDTFAAPEGHGFIAIASFEWDGDRYEYSRTYLEGRLTGFEWRKASVTE